MSFKMTNRICTFICMGFLAAGFGCSDNHENVPARTTTEVVQNGFSQLDLRKNPELRLRNYNTAALQLEHPQAPETGISDTPGVVIAPYYFEKSRSHQIRFGGDIDPAVDHLEIQDVEGNTVLTLYPDEVSKAVYLEQGEYHLIVYHSEETAPDHFTMVFFHPDFAPVTESDLLFTNPQTMESAERSASPTTPGNCTDTKAQWALLDSWGEILMANSAPSDCSLGNGVIQSGAKSSEWWSYDNECFGDINGSASKVFGGAQQLFDIYSCGTSDSGENLMALYSQYLGGWLTAKPDDSGKGLNCGYVIAVTYDHQGTDPLPDDSLFTLDYLNDGKLQLSSKPHGLLGVIGDLFRGSAVAYNHLSLQTNCPSCLGNQCPPIQCIDGYCPPPPVPRAWEPTDGDTLLTPSQYIGIAIITAQCENCNFDGINLERYNLSDVVFTGSSFSGAQFVDAYMPGALLNKCNLFNANFFKASFFNLISQPSIANATSLTGARFSNALLIGLDATGITLDNTAFSQANLCSANFTGAQIPRSESSSNVDFSYANLKGTNFTNNNFSGNLNLTNAFVNFEHPTASEEYIVQTQYAPAQTNKMSFNFGETKPNPLDTNSNTICPNTENGPCGEDDWTPESPPKYKGCLLCEE